MRRSMLCLFIICLMFSFIGNVSAVYSEDAFLANTNYETELKKFPESYQEKINELHKIYPNAIFISQTKFFDWNKYKEVEVNWNDMVTAETKGYTSEIESSAPSNYKTSTCDKAGCSWVVASKEAVEYYMNPYNFLDEKHVFMFESQYYNSKYQTKDGVEKILAGTFMNDKDCPGANKKYSDVIIEAAEKYKISPYLLAARLRQENGKGTSPLVTGDYSKYDITKIAGEAADVTYYNFFNIQASGANPIVNGYYCANGTLKNSAGKKLCDGYSWSSPYLSIMGGSQFIYKKYIGVNDTYNVLGQMNLYLQKWDAYGPSYGGHQYMQNIRAPYYEAQSLYNSYTVFDDFKNFKYVFYIPIYKDAPNLMSENKNENNQIKLGDLNEDNNIDSADLLKIRQHLIGTKKLEGNSLVAADVNKDGVVDSADLLRIRQHLIGTKKIEG